MLLRDVKSKSSSSVTVESIELMLFWIKIAENYYLSGTKLTKECSSESSSSKS